MIDSFACQCSHINPFDAIPSDSEPQQSYHNPTSPNSAPQMAMPMPIPRATSPSNLIDPYISPPSHSTPMSPPTISKSRQAVSPGDTSAAYGGDAYGGYETPLTSAPPPSQPQGPSSSSLQQQSGGPHYSQPLNLYTTNPTSPPTSPSRQLPATGAMYDPQLAAQQDEQQATVRPPSYTTANGVGTGFASGPRRGSMDKSGGYFR